MKELLGVILTSTVSCMNYFKDTYSNGWLDRPLSLIMEVA